MGSGQSHPVNNANDGNDAKFSTAASRTPENDSPSSTATKLVPAIDESGYARAQRLCRKKKRAYDACYTAQISSKEEDCDDLFETYRTCFLNVMSKDMQKRGVKVSEDSMIGEYKEELADDGNSR